MKAESMWEQFSIKKNIDASYDAWVFCGGGEIGDCLAHLVLEGKKTATASAYISYQQEQEELPKNGCYSVVLYDTGEAACIIQTQKVSLVPFDEVSERHAYLEGEGDRSLAYWRQAHRRAFTPEYQAAGKKFDEHGLIVLEEFKMVFSQQEEEKI